ncbi:MAG: hypothetical protein M3R08_11010, partial [Bacteroidota bacterium]|nr:hypothetical protein [Bacteroidota bacterium]
MKEHLAGRKLLYLGSDTAYHHFEYHHRTAFYSFDKLNRWAVMGFKIPITEYSPEEKISYSERHRMRG